MTHPPIRFDSAVRLIINPASGRGRAARLRHTVADALVRKGFTVTEHVTLDLADAAEAARTAPPGTLVASLGGDGLLGAVAAGVSDSSAVLLPLGGGRGNDTLRRLGLMVDPIRSIREIDALRIASVDLGRVNGVPFLGVANVGFDGRAAEIANATRFNLGPMTYLYGGARALMTWRDVSFAVTVDDQRRSFTGWFVAVGNVGQYGGGLRITPNALADDGQMDVVTLGSAGAGAAVSTFLKAFAGVHLGHRAITEVRGQRITIDADVPLNIYADGELIGPLPATIETSPAAVKVLVPMASPALGSVPLPAADTVGGI
ncbi:MAG TPA: diacylglycerol kinase family protein [Glaciibacter sp.]|nr:diacylglycerol kinase family protein [Glaciibacter sp.]